MGLAPRTWPLSRKILALALLNLALIATVLLGFAEWQFGLSLESLVLGPARDRIAAIAESLARELDSTPYQSRSELMAAYAARYGADFYLVDPWGQSLAGQTVTLPGVLLERMRQGGGRGPGGGGRKGPEAMGPEFDPEGRGPAGMEGRGGRLPGQPGPEGGPAAERIFLTLTHHPLSYWVGVRMPTGGPNGERGVPAILLLRSDSIWNARLFFDWRSLLWLAAALAAVALACWWPFVYGVTVSIRQMDRATEAIAEGRFGSHVTLARGDELGHLGGQINRMAERLEGFVRRQKRFLGDIAHELCAPIARVQFALGILEQKIDEPGQAHLAVLREEIQEMSALVNELLMFSKAGMTPGETPLKRVELGPVIARAMEHQLPGTGTIQSNIPAGLAALACEPYLLRAVSNLLRNALRYAGADGPILVTARREGERVVLTVADCGPGLPEQALEDVFAPFYRPEAARSRDTGGAGLGLAIVKSCIEACRGTVACRNRQPSGLEVTIVLGAGESGPVG